MAYTKEFSLLENSYLLKHSCIELLGIFIMDPGISNILDPALSEGVLCNHPCLSVRPSVC